MKENFDIEFFKRQGLENKVLAYQAISRLICGVVNTALYPAGITSQQFFIIDALIINKMTTPEAVEFLGVERTTMLRILKTLTENNIVERKGSDSDKRRVIYKLTRNGDKAFEKAAHHIQFFNEWIKKLLINK